MFDSVNREHCLRILMRLQNEFSNGLFGLLATKLIMRWMRTLDYRVAYADPTIDPIYGVGGRRIYVFWHENILFPLYLRGHCHLTMLLSRHRDADVLATIARLSGFGTVRGSTGRGGQEALRELVKISETDHVTITPDGPRGPRRQLAHGPIYLSSRTGLPIVAMGFGYDRPWRLNSWDRFAIPKPFSRARAVVAPPIQIPRNISRDDAETHRLAVQDLLVQLTDDANNWAESGKRRKGEVVTDAQFAPRPESKLDTETSPTIANRAA